MLFLPGMEAMASKGWMPFPEHKPGKKYEYELVYIAYESGRQQVAWWTGSYWDALKPIREEKVVAWKFKGNL